MSTTVTITKLQRKAPSFRSEIYMVSSLIAMAKCRL